MNNDLISRKYMKEAIEQFFVREKYYHPYSKGRKTIPTEEVLDIIDTAPTIEPQKVPIANVTFDEEKLKELTDDIVERIKSGEIVLQDERPKGTCKTCRCRDPEDKKCDCGALERQGCPFPVSDDYYCKYYEKGGAE